MKERPSGFMARAESAGKTAIEACIGMGVTATLVMVCDVALGDGRSAARACLVALILLNGARIGKRLVP